MNPILIIVRGIPGSGKSYLSAKLKESLGDKAVLLDPDATDYASNAYKNMSADLSAQGVEVKFHPYRFLRAQAYNAIEKDGHIIWNQAWTNIDGLRKTVTNLSNYANDNQKKLSVLLVEVDIDVETARARTQQREDSGAHGVSDEEFDRFIRDYQPVSPDEFTVIKIRGDADVSQSADVVINTIDNL